MTEPERNLRDLLARLYRRDEQIERFLADAGLDAVDVDFHGSSLTIWHRLIEIASFGQKIPSLIRVARQQFPENAELRIAEESGLQEKRGPELRGVGEVAAESLEALTQGASTLLPVQFLKQGLKCAQSVAKVFLADGGFGSGFLLSENWFLTNHHVIPDKAAAAGAWAGFDFEEIEDGTWRAPVRFQFNPTKGFHTSSAETGDDWTAVKLEGDANATYGALQLSNRRLRKNEFVNIIQHPGGAPKKIALYHNTVTEILDRRLRYLTDTQPGSSGSPVFNSRWEVVALHHASTEAPDPRNSKYYTCNEGIPSSVLIPALRKSAVNC